ncbi:disease resistance protein At4g27190-like [Apium graveolens]|uniref:disease resistance protein At4g27190-like n=1 Tax=Apium graveolens TaxID=4045 RepID=UPI003D7BFA14
MVGLFDIPCLGKVVDRLSDGMVDLLFRGFNYMFCYKDHVNVLNSEIEKVKIEEVRVSRKAVAATAMESAKEFEERCKNRSSWWCIHYLPIPKPVSRFRLGREAVHMAERATELSDSAKDLLANDIAYLPPLENVPKTDTAFQDFDSRKDAFEKLWEGLASVCGPQILGIYGMPGVGKTRMMEQIWQEAMEKKIFDKVARADVGSEELDVIELQNQIAGHLNCHFQSQNNKMQRANQLKYSLKNGGKILIILYDVWSYVPVVDIIGTSFADDSCSNSSKILLTSREKYDESLIQEVCNKCAGLPLLINAVGKALKCRPHNSWKDGLYQLEKGKVEKVAGIDPHVYACVKLSMDKLPEDAKSCLFLCSLYPEDAVIPINELIQLATGTRLIPDGESRVWAVVDILRSSSLLLDCWKAHTNKLHDLIRDVARSIAVRDPKYAFLTVRCGTRLPENADYCTRKLLYL